MPKGRHIQRFKKGQSFKDLSADGMTAISEAAAMIHNLSVKPPLRASITKNSIALSIDNASLRRRVAKEIDAGVTEDFVVVRSIPSPTAEFVRVQRVVPDMIDATMTYTTPNDIEDMATWPKTIADEYAIFVHNGDIVFGTIILPARKIRKAWWVVPQHIFDADRNPFDVRESDCIRGRV